MLQQWKHLPKPGVVFAKALEPVESDKSKRIWAFIMMA